MPHMSQQECELAIPSPGSLSSYNASNNPALPCHASAMTTATSDPVQYAHNSSCNMSNKVRGFFEIFSERGWPRGEGVTWGAWHACQRFWTIVLFLDKYMKFWQTCRLLGLE